MPLAGEPVISHVVNRTRRVIGVDEVIVATSVEESDDPIAEWCLASAVPLFRGALDDVLGRYVECAIEFDATSVVRITADCPALDPRVSSKVVAEFKRSGVDYSALTGHFPKGLDTQIFSLEALMQSAQNSKSPNEREHIGIHIEANPSLFTSSHVTLEPQLRGFRWTLDFPEDYEFLTRIFEELFPQNPEFGMFEILELLEKFPQFRQINAQHPS